MATEKPAKAIKERTCIFITQGLKERQPERRGRQERRNRGPPQHVPVYVSRAPCFIYIPDRDFKLQDEPNERWRLLLQETR